MKKLLPAPLQGALFDLDGTLVDTAADFADVLGHMLTEARLPPLPFEDIHRTVSNGARALVEMAFGCDSSHPQFEERLNTLLALYGQRITQTKASLYPDMDTLLQTFERNGIPWGVVTNKPERFSRPLLESLGLRERCSVLVCPDHVSQTKPHPEPLLLACEQLSIAPTQAIYVGDHPRDIDAGRAAGMFTVAVRYGYLPASPAVELWRADCIVDSVAGLLRCLPDHLRPSSSF